MIDYAAAREAMVDRQVRTADVTRYPIIAAMLAVPREDFLPGGAAPGRLSRRARAAGARAGAARPAGLRQAPRRARPSGPSDLVLDLGCGLGYSTAVLAQMAEAVVALESDPAHGRRGRGAARGAWRRQRRGAGRPARRRRGRARALRRHPGRGRDRDAAARASRRSSRSGGRIAAIFAEGAGGQARLGLRTPRRDRLAAYLRCHGPGAAGVRGDESI